MRFRTLLTAVFTGAIGANAGAYPPLGVAGESAGNGIYDPSVEYDTTGAVGWLAYSAVFGAILPWGPHVETHLARSTDAGATWTLIQTGNASTPGSVTWEGSLVAGVWNAEVASLVHDPDDLGREWKLFSHRMFRRTENPFTQEQNLPAYGWIALRTASDPAGTWSAEIPLFGSALLPLPPYSVQVDVTALDPSLAGLLTFSEPGAFHREGVLYLSLTGLTASGTDRILLLASGDHGAHWRYAGTPLSNADAAALGALSFDGSAIAEQSGRIFLLVSPRTAAVVHDGTWVFEFADLDSGALRRGANGAPILVKTIPPQFPFLSEVGGGQSDFHAANSNGGILMPQIQLPAYPKLFQIFQTGEMLIPTVSVPALSAGARWLAALALGLALLAAVCAAPLRGR